MRWYSQVLKPTMDLSASTILLLFFSWAFLIIGLAYLVSFQLPLFYRQVRLGRDEKHFTIFKFRTLRKGGGSILERKFPLGTLLRSLSLDELPQLWNVLKGEMSFVGPRPLPVEYGPLFSESQRKRFSVKPGITGWAQVNGRHGIPWQKKFELDNWYVDHQSFWLDLRIILKTALLLLSFRKDTSLEEPPFSGSN